MTLLAFNPETTRMPTHLSADKLHLGYRDRKIVHDLSVKIPPHEFTVIVGANACGKSTLLRGLARLLPPRRGAVYLDGKPIHQLPTREVTTILGVLPQSPIAPDAISVADLVGRGRYPHQGWFRRWTAEDDTAVAEALAATDTAELADRPVDELSGGQRQRVWIAMALAQETDGHFRRRDRPARLGRTARRIEMRRDFRAVAVVTRRSDHRGDGKRDACHMLEQLRHLTLFPRELLRVAQMLILAAAAAASSPRSTAPRTPPCTPRRSPPSTSLRA